MRGILFQNKYSPNVTEKHNLDNVFLNMFLFHSEEPHQPKSFKQKTQPFKLWMSMLCWLQCCIGQPKSQPSLYSNALLESEVEENMKTKTDLPFFILVSGKKTTVCSVFSSFSRKPGVWVGRFLFRFYFYFSSSLT